MSVCFHTDNIMHMGANESIIQGLQKKKKANFNWSCAPVAHPWWKEILRECTHTHHTHTFMYINTQDKNKSFWQVASGRATVGNHGFWYTFSMWTSQKSGLAFDSLSRGEPRNFYFWIASTVILKSYFP